MDQNPNNMDLANKFVAQFDSFDDIVIEGVSSDGSNDPEAINVGFKLSLIHISEPTRPY